MNKWLLNVEADEILYRAAFAVEKQCYKLTTKNGSSYNFSNRYTKTQIVQRLKEKNITNYNLEGYKKVEPLRFALHIVKMQLQHLQQIGDIYLWLSPSDGSNFRFKVAKTPGPRGVGYKAGRPPRPVYYEEIRKYLINAWGATEFYGMEADDALGIMQKEDTVAVHIDKDINMIQGKHYHWVKQERYFVEKGLGDLPTKESRGTGKAFFFHQMLTGDHVDNIPGIKAIGPVKATKILSEAKTEQDMLSIVAKHYKEQYGEGFKKQLLEMADLLYIMDKEDRKGRDYIRSVLND